MLEITYDTLSNTSLSDAEYVGLKYLRDLRLRVFVGDKGENGREVHLVDTDDNKVAEIRSTASTELRAARRMLHSLGKGFE